MASNSKQATLHQAWTRPPSQATKPKAKKYEEFQEFNDDVDEEALLAMVMAESLKETEANDGPQPGTSGFKPSATRLTHQHQSEHPVRQNAVPEQDLDGMGFEEDDFNVEEMNTDKVDLSKIENIPGFDLEAGRLWIYPTNYPVRDYQFNITDHSLYKNTMVTLPTGLGKTFIAAVVMYNFYRWYPQGKVVFMAPTKPLVAQQIEACYNIMGIPQEDTAEMTGAMQPAERKRVWLARRVFFLTPQVLTNDLSRQTCPSDLIRCLVIDEAHKAKGNHAYCQVVRELIKHNNQFRVLALSATPGSDLKSVQEVLGNLLISHIELRSEDSIDIMPYTHERKVEKIVIPLGVELKQFIDKYLAILSVTVAKLKRFGVMYNKDLKSVSKFMVLKQRDAFRQNPPHTLQRSQFGIVEGDFGLLISLYHGYELLQQHGLRSLYHYLEGLVTGEKGSGRTKAELGRNPNFKEMMDYLQNKFEPVNGFDPNKSVRTPTASQKQKPFPVGHPKMAKLEEIAVAHFKKFMTDDGTSNTRVMIFSQYRDSVSEIAELLARHRPLIKVMSFIGQSTGKSAKGFTQKEQLKVMKQFREGGYNTLVSTCVGEEGLDIGDVDLIICFDAHKSPIRLVQRMGRTGRKREGRIVMLVTEGKEEQIYNTSQYTKNSIKKAILNGTKTLAYYEANPRMIPDGLTPACHKMYISVTKEFQAASKSRNTVVNPKSDISTMLKKTAGGGGKTKARNDGYLTEEELRYWSENFKVNDCDTFSLPKSKMLCLEKKGELVPPSPLHPGHELSLTEWMPWQMQLQPSKISGHSKRTQNLVEILEFMDIQNAVGPDEDAYGQEMKTFLNKDDVITTSQASGIRRFCTPSAPADKAQAKTKKRKSDEGDDVPKKKKRASRILAEMDLDFQDPILVSDDEDLPPAFGAMTTVDDEDSRDSVTFGTSRMVDSKKSKKKLFNSRESILTYNENAEPIVGVKERKKKKKSGSLERPLSVLQPIQDRDEDDFCEPILEPRKRTSPTTDKNQQIIDWSTSSRNRTLPGGYGRSSPEHPKADCDKNAGVPNRGDDIDINDDLDVNDDDWPEAFEPAADFKDGGGDGEERSDSPVFQSQCRHGTQVKLSQCSTFRAIADNKVERVKTPPPFEDIAAAMESLDAKGHISPLDVLELVDVWNSDMREGLLDSCKQKLDMEEANLSDTNNRVNVTKSGRNSPIRETGGEESLSRSDVLGNTTHTPQGLCGRIPLFGRKSTSPKKEASPVYSPAKSGNASDRAPLASETDSETAIPAYINNIPNEIPDSESQSTNQSEGLEGFRVPEISHEKEEPSPEENAGVVPFELYEEGSEERTDSETCFTREEPTIFTDTTLQEDSPVFLTPASVKVSPKSSSSIGQMKGFVKASATLSPDVDTSVDVKIHVESKPPSGVSPLFNFTTPSACAPKSASRAITRTPVSDEHDSFFSADGADDSLFAAIVTPGATPARLADTSCTQITFTQAMNCVHDSSSLSSSKSSTSASPELPDDALRSRKLSDDSSRSRTLTEDISRRRTFDPSPERMRAGAPCDAGRTPDLTTCDTTVPNDTLCIPAVTPVNVVAQTTLEVAEADFDLGFDLDFDDDMVPPSPQCTQPPSQISQPFQPPPLLLFPPNTTIADTTSMSSKEESVLSQSCLIGGIGRRRSSSEKSSPEPAPFTAIKDKHTSNLPEFTCEDACDFETMDPFLDDDLSDFEELNHEALANAEEESQSILEPPKSQRNIYESAKPPSHGQYRNDTVVVQGHTVSSASVDIDIDEESQSLLGTQHQCLPTQPITSEHKSSQEKPVARVTPSPAQALLNNVVMDDEGDDSPIQAPKRKRKMIIDSPETPAADCHGNGRETFKTPLKPAPKSKKQILMKTPEVLVPTDDESPVIRMKKRSNKLTIEDDDDDFVDTRSSKTDKGKWLSKETRQSDTSRKTSSHKQLKAKTTKKPKRRGGNQFIDEEADLSGEASTDESDEDLDRLEDSFVNDATQLTQETHTEDMQAVYMRSVRSPQLGRYKLNYRPDVPLMDVYSQVPDPMEASEYQEDSFCVGDDFQETVYMESTEDEITPVKLAKKSRKATKNRMKKPEGRKRIARFHDSSSEEEMVADLGEVTQCASPKQQHHGSKARLIRSDTSGSDASSTKESPEVVCHQPHATNSQGYATNTGPGSDPDSPTGYTQMPSLKSRLEMRMSNTTTNEYADHQRKSEISGSIDPRPNKNASSINNPGPNSSIVMSREERLRLSRLKQEEFRRRKLSGDNQSNADNSSVVNQSNITLTSEGNKSNTSKNMSENNNLAESSMGQSILSTSTVSVTNQNSFVAPGPNRRESLGHGKPVILVDSKEINGAQDMVSNLRSRHGMHTCVRQLGACDYVISNRMAVDRKLVDDIGNGANRARVLERVRAMCKEYERPVLIIEKERVKPGEKDTHKPLLRSKYVEGIVASLAVSHIKIVFSDNQDQTACLLSELSELEARKEHNIRCPVELSPVEQQMLKFFLCIPHVSYVTGLNLVHGYRNIKEFIASPAVVIEKRGRVSKHKADQMVKFVQHQFSPHMVVKAKR